MAARSLADMARRTVMDTLFFREHQPVDAKKTFDCTHESNASAATAEDSSRPLGTNSSPDSSACAPANAAGTTRCVTPSCQQSVETHLTMETTEDKAIRKRHSLSDPKWTAKYVVKDNDTLVSIAACFDVTPTLLKKANRLTLNFIYPGQLLRVPSELEAAEYSTPVPNTGDGSDGRRTSEEQLAEGEGEAGLRPPLVHKLLSCSSIGAEEASELDMEVVRKFVKLNAKYITDGSGIVGGTLLVTPNALMFDPNVSNRLVIENGAEIYAVMAPMEMIMGVAIYRDLEAMSYEREHKVNPHLPKPEVYHGEGSEPATAGPAGELGAPSFQETYVDQPPVTGLSPEPVISGLNDKPAVVGARDEPAATSGPSDMPAATASSVDEPAITTTSNEPPVNDPSMTIATISESLHAATSSAEQTHLPSNLELPSNGLLDSRNSVMGSSAEVCDIVENVVPTRLPSLNDDISSNTKLGGGNGSRNLVHTCDAASDRMRSADGAGAVCTFSLDGAVFSLDDDFKAAGQDGAIGAGAEVLTDESFANRTTSPLHRLCSTGSLDLAVEAMAKGEADGSMGAGDGEGKLQDHLTGNALEPADKPDLFQAVDELLVRQCNEDQADSCQSSLYLCLKIGMPVHKQLSNISHPIESYNQRKKPEYWFSIPMDKAACLYAFFLHWSPEIYDVGDFEPLDKGFVAIGDDELGKKVTEETFYVGNPKMTKKLVRQMTKDWEIVSIGELRARQTLLEVEKNLPLPELDYPSAFLTEDHRRELVQVLPLRLEGCTWHLAFSTELHGFSLSKMYRNMQDVDSPILLVVQDTEERVFGALTSSPFTMSEHFCGTGESFLFTFVDRFTVYAWTGDNDLFHRGSLNNVWIGSGEGTFGLYLDGDIYKGRTQRCKTYGNEPLTGGEEEFVVKRLEAWYFFD